MLIGRSFTVILYLWMKREKEGEEKDEVRVVQQLRVLEETHG
jgi:hypothetical protein